ncbi:PREDICTED: transmembrane protein FAM155A [Haliaeetus leucocephalus]|uniref:transmembrane protein FAM155A n=1 Tax=Haliaeetus leucocephalus TaxID=52644 RepID=UPI00053CAF79|nr:PREDICTED: transmembrane protein FAM155A [Haliaeetus leucocephalus]
MADTHVHLRQGVHLLRGLDPDERVTSGLVKELGKKTQHTLPLDNKTVHQREFCLPAAIHAVAKSRPWPCAPELSAKYGGGCSSTDPFSLRSVELTLCRAGHATASASPSFQQVSSLISEKQGLQTGFLRNGDESGTAGPADQSINPSEAGRSAGTCSKTDRAISDGNGWPVPPAKRSDLQKKRQRSAAARGRSGPRCCRCSIALRFNQKLDRTGFGGNATQGKLPGYQKEGTVYKAWLCSQYFEVTQFHCSNRIPCKQYCLEVQTRCPFILPDNDDVIYGGLSSFICTGLYENYPTNAEPECCDVRWGLLSDHQSKGTIKTSGSTMCHRTSLTVSSASRLCNSRLKLCVLVLILLHTVLTVSAAQNSTGLGFGGITTLEDNSTNEE